MAAVYLRVSYLSGITFSESIENKLWHWERRYKGVKLPRNKKKDGGVGLTIAQWEEKQLAEMREKEKKHYKKFAESLYGLPLEQDNKPKKKGKKKKEKPKAEPKQEEPLDPIAQWERQQRLQLEEKERQNRKREKQERKELRKKLRQEKLQRKEKRRRKALNRKKKWPISQLNLEEALLSISPKITQLPLVSFIQALKKEKQTNKSWVKTIQQKEKLWLKVHRIYLGSVWQLTLLTTRQKSTIFVAWN